MVAVDDATTAQQNAVTEYFRTTKYGFWHYLSDLWLVTDVSNTLTAATLRDKLKDLVPGATTLVIQLDQPKDWAGFGQSNVFDWFKSTWVER